MAKAQDGLSRNLLEQSNERSDIACCFARLTCFSRTARPDDCTDELELGPPFVGYEHGIDRNGGVSKAARVQLRERVGHLRHDLQCASKLNGLAAAKRSQGARRDVLADEQHRAIVESGAIHECQKKWMRDASNETRTFHHCVATLVEPGQQM